MKNETIERLKKTIARTKDNTLYTILRHVSQSGMQRSIDVYAIVDNEPYFLTGAIAEVLGYKMDKKNRGLKIRGAGMDMGFAIVYDLSVRLYCNEKYDHDKAYFLKQRWL